MPSKQPPPASPAAPPELVASRTALFDTTFWEVLPSHYTSISTRFSNIAHLHAHTHTGLLATDRAGALNSLKAELDMLEHDLTAYRNIVRSIDITDIAGIYVVAGRGPHRALQLAKEDLEGLEGSLKEVEERVAECRAGVRYAVWRGAVDVSGTWVPFRQVDGGLS